MELVETKPEFFRAQNVDLLKPIRLTPANYGLDLFRRPFVQAKHSVDVLRPDLQVRFSEVGFAFENQVEQELTEFERFRVRTIRDMGLVLSLSGYVRIFRALAHGFSKRSYRIFRALGFSTRLDFPRAFVGQLVVVCSAASSVVDYGNTFSFQYPQTFNNSGNIQTRILGKAANTWPAVIVSPDPVRNNCENQFGTCR